MNFIWTYFLISHLMKSHVSCCLQSKLIVRHALAAVLCIFCFCLTFSQKISLCCCKYKGFYFARTTKSFETNLDSNIAGVSLGLLCQGLGLFVVTCKRQQCLKKNSTRTFETVVTSISKLTELRIVKCPLPLCSACNQFDLLLVLTGKRISYYGDFLLVNCKRFILPNPTLFFCC